MKCSDRGQFLTSLSFLLWIPRMVSILRLSIKQSEKLRGGGFPEPIIGSHSSECFSSAEHGAIRKKVSECPINNSGECTQPPKLVIVLEYSWNNWKWSFFLYWVDVFQNTRHIRGFLLLLCKCVPKWELIKKHENGSSLCLLNGEHNKSGVMPHVKNKNCGFFTCPLGIMRISLLHGAGIVGCSGGFLDHIKC